MGAKGGIRVDYKALSDSEKERLTKKFFDTPHPFIGVNKDIPVPVVNTGAREMAWGLDRMRKSMRFWEYGILTGKPKRLGEQCAPADGVPPPLTSSLAQPNIVPPSYQLNRFFGV